MSFKKGGKWGRYVITLRRKTHRPTHAKKESLIKKYNYYTLLITDI